MSEKPQVIGLIGPPGAGKSTFTETLDPKKWVVLELDQIRTGLWPPHRRKYWEVREDKEAGPRAKKLLHDVQLSMLMYALNDGWNVVLSDQHHTVKTFEDEIYVIEECFKIKIQWKAFIVPWMIIEKRNRTRPELHRLPDKILSQEFSKVYDPRAWWRKREDVELIHVDLLGNIVEGDRTRQLDTIIRGATWKGRDNEN